MKLYIYKLLALHPKYAIPFRTKDIVGYATEDRNHHAS
jgi:hypothetical protein